MTQVLMLLGVLVICVIANRIAEWRAAKQFKKENYTTTPTW
jgi:hypothetical protein